MTSKRDSTVSILLSKPRRPPHPHWLSAIYLRLWADMQTKLRLRPSEGLTLRVLMDRPVDPESPILYFLDQSNSSKYREASWRDFRKALENSDDRSFEVLHNISVMRYMSGRKNSAVKMAQAVANARPRCNRALLTAAFMSMHSQKDFSESFKFLTLIFENHQIDTTKQDSISIEEESDPKMNRDEALVHAVYLTARLLVVVQSKSSIKMKDFSSIKKSVKFPEVLPAVGDTTFYSPDSPAVRVGNGAGASFEKLGDGSSGEDSKSTTITTTSPRGILRPPSGGASAAEPNSDSADRQTPPFSDSDNSDDQLKKALVLIRWACEKQPQNALYRAYLNHWSFFEQKEAEEGRSTDQLQITTNSILTLCKEILSTKSPSTTVTTGDVGAVTTSSTTSQLSNSNYESESESDDLSGSESEESEGEGASGQWRGVADAALKGVLAAGAAYLLWRGYRFMATPTTNQHQHQPPQSSIAQNQNQKHSAPTLTPTPPEGQRASMPAGQSRGRRQWERQKGEISGQVESTSQPEGSPQGNQQQGDSSVSPLPPPPEQEDQEHVPQAPPNAASSMAQDFRSRLAQHSRMRAPPPPPPSWGPQGDYPPPPPPPPPMYSPPGFDSYPTPMRGNLRDRLNNAPSRPFPQQRPSVPYRAPPPVRPPPGGSVFGGGAGNRGGVRTFGSMARSTSGAPGGSKFAAFANALQQQQAGRRP